MNGHEKRREDKKNAILHTAVELFGQYGFERVTIIEIAEKAHVSKVTIYNFFESKENLRRIIIKDILAEATKKVELIFKQEEDFTKKINKYIQFRIEYTRSIKFQLLIAAVESDPEIKKLFSNYTVINRQLLMDFIEEGKNCGFFSPEVSRAAIAIYIDIFQSYYVNRNFNNENIALLESDAELAEEVNMLFWDGFIRNQIR